MYCYKCRECKKEFEYPTRDLDKCPYCKGKVIRNYKKELLGIQFKGKGFYSTDSREK